jgi:hypothetical protein
MTLKGSCHCRATQFEIAEAPAPVSQLADHHRQRRVAAGHLPRLRCQRCGDPPRAVKQSDGGGPAAREVWLTGGP